MKVVVNLLASSRASLAPTEWLILSRTPVGARLAREEAGPAPADIPANLVTQPQASSRSYMHMRFNYWIYLF
jgi:hypothetical protein